MAHFRQMRNIWYMFEEALDEIGNQSKGVVVINDMTNLTTRNLDKRIMREFYRMEKVFPIKVRCVVLQLW